MTYEQVAGITQVAALLFFVALFAGVVIYAYWPGNKKRFQKDAEIPLKKDPDHEMEEGDG
jgi:cytochrome c oxidase cbb3-type subunit 4